MFLHLSCPPLEVPSHPCWPDRWFHSDGNSITSTETIHKATGLPFGGPGMKWRIARVISSSPSPERLSGALLAPHPPFHTGTPKRAQRSTGRLRGRQAHPVPWHLVFLSLNFSLLVWVVRGGFWVFFWVVFCLPEETVPVPAP